MADQAKRPRLEENCYNYEFLTDAKVDEIVAKYPSTVFACDTSADTRYIKCDFPKCSKHAGGKESWMLNTVKNVCILEKHVGKEVARFTKENLGKALNFNLESGLNIIRSQYLDPQIEKVLVILELEDPQSQLGEWMSLFLRAAELHLDVKSSNVQVITQSFTSRRELMWCITKLEFLKRYNVEVLSVLSCHSSSQGQVFSCTPTIISKQFEYEEFCSLHDYIQASQDVLGESLKAAHISSCYTLKLDCSHQEWPFDVRWLKSKLQCVLSGSTKEVYETGSQVADLYVILATLLNSYTMAHALKSTIEAAVDSEFPDLASEMGLGVLDRKVVDHKISKPGFDDEVSAPSCVNSSIHVVILFGCGNQECINSTETSIDVTNRRLAEALTANLKMRQMSDVKCNYTTLFVRPETDMRQKLTNCVKSIFTMEENAFFVLLGPFSGHSNNQFLNIIAEIQHQFHGRGWLYGIHFQNLTPIQAYSMKNKLKSLYSSNYHNMSSDYTNMVVTGSVNESKADPVQAFPVLLYMVHLAIGENGERLSGKGITPAHLKYRQYRGPGISYWTLEDVYMETSYVLSGLSRKIGLCLISSPTRFTSGIQNGKLDSVTEKAGQLMEPKTSICPSSTKQLTKVDYEFNQYDQNDLRNLDTDVDIDLSTVPLTTNCDVESIPNGGYITLSKLDVLKNQTTSERPTLGAGVDTTNNDISVSQSSTTKNDLSSHQTTSNIVISSLLSASTIEESRSTHPVLSNTTPVVNCRYPSSTDSELCKQSCADNDYDTLTTENVANVKQSPIPSASTTLTTHQNSIRLPSSINAMSKYCLTEKPNETESQLITPDCNDIDITMSDSHDQLFAAQCSTVDINDHQPADARATDYCIEACSGVRNAPEPLCTNSIAVTEADRNNINHKLSSKEITDPNHEEVVLNITKGSSTGKTIDSEDEYVCITDDDDDVPCTDRKWDNSSDLPLMANVDEVLVYHYVLNLKVNFDEKMMHGDITLFLKPANKMVNVDKMFQLCLDCSLVTVTSVEEITLRNDFSVTYYGTCDQGSSPLPSDIFQVDKYKESTVSLQYTLLPYAVHNWCMRIWKPNKLGTTWPHCIRIKYSTKPEGKSLTWATDQDSRPCVFSPGAYINNRSLMPCQEPPIALSTWQAAIHVPTKCTVLMSGSQLLVEDSNVADENTFLFEMRVPLPCSTLALAIGWFEYRESSAVVMSSHIPCRVYSTPSIIDRAAAELLEPCTKYISAACHLLGQYPFSTINLLILPRCFACMGLMSPNVAFLSQSILVGDESMCVRVAHEISHSWFGLLIGSKDWSEEWLSEGFATYMEERIQCHAAGWQGNEEKDRVELRQILKHRTLLAELQYTDENLQMLRPKLPNVVTAAEAVRRSVEGHKENNKEEGNEIVPHSTVTNGQVCSRKWTQIHYLKGYFLLHYMASMVGPQVFDNFLKMYVADFGGKLVKSEEFFEFFDKHFPAFGNLKDRLIKEWLESHGLPVYVPKKIGSSKNYLINQVESEFSFWKKIDAVNKRKKTQRKRSKTPIKDRPKLNDPFQLVVLLERLLERESFATATLTQLDHCYKFSDKNAEVRHRWCELIVKHNYQPGFPHVKNFLIEDQGMGIYLFGELLISQQSKQKQMVLDVLSIIGAEMDQCTLKTVQDMLEGKD